MVHKSLAHMGKLYESSIEKDPRFGAPVLISVILVQGKIPK